MKKLNIKRWIKEILITLVIVFVMTNVISFIRKPDVESKPFPQIEATLIDGSKFSTKELKNKPFILHFWATWCPTCKLEISNYDELAKEYEVITVAVNSGDNGEIQKFLQDRDLHFKVLNDKEGKLANYFGVEGFPTTFIFDKDKKIVTAEVGYTSTLKLKAWLWYLNR